MKSHKEPDKDDKKGYRGKGDNDSDDKRKSAKKGK